MVCIGLKFSWWTPAYLNDAHIPVTLSVKSRVVTVKGKRGTLVKSFKHLSIEMVKVGKNRLRIDIWFANRKELACLNTVVGHLKNLFKGVTYVSKDDVSLWEAVLVESISELNWACLLNICDT